MIIKKPLQIYLDSSDYSHMAEGRSQDTKIFLKQCIDEKKIEIRYSFITVSEFIQTDKKYQDYAVERAKLINYLCNSKTLIIQPNLLLNECIYICQKNTLLKYPDYAFNDNGQWYGDLESIFSDFKKGLFIKTKSLIQQEVNKVKDRNQKSLIRTQLLKVIKNDKFTPEGLSLLKGTEREIFNELPIINPEKLENLFHNYLQGEITTCEFSNIIGSHCLNPENLSTWTISKMDDGIIKFGWLRNKGSLLVDKISELRSLFQRLESQISLKGNPRQHAIQEIKNFKFDYEKLKIEILHNCWKKNQFSFQKAGISYSQFQKNICSQPDAPLPSLDILKDIFEIYFKENLIDNKRNLKPSDFGDISHGVYIPYVNIFRADKYMAKHYEPLSKKYLTELAISLDDLPDKINSMLKTTN